ncbi:MAG: DUF502 domain-containing protein [Acidobacteriota bacterium]
MLNWMRRKFVTGLVVMVPLVISLATLVWIFQLVDGFVGPVWERWIGVEVPGLGILSTALLVLLVGVLASNMLGKRLVGVAESALVRVPVFRTIYSPVKQLVEAFSPDNAYGFKRVVIVEDPRRGRVLGFLTREFTLDLGRGPERLVAVYVPTNHLYLGDLVLVPHEEVSYPDLSVEEGVRVILTGGMSLPDRVRAHDGADRVRDARV